MRLDGMPAKLFKGAFADTARGTNYVDSQSLLPQYQ